MNKKLIRLTEQDLHRIVRESVNKVLKEEVKYGRYNPGFDYTAVGSDEPEEDFDLDYGEWDEKGGIVLDKNGTRINRYDEVRWTDPKTGESGEYEVIWQPDRTKKKGWVVIMNRDDQRIVRPEECEVINEYIPI